jgi:hypothetical protein
MYSPAEHSSGGPRVIGTEASRSAGADGLPSWRGGATKAIVDFVGRVTGTLRLLIVHDDSEREFDYTTGAEQALQLAATDGWTVARVKTDWASVFPATSD